MAGLGAGLCLPCRLVALGIGQRLAGRSRRSAGRILFARHAASALEAGWRAWSLLSPPPVEDQPPMPLVYASRHGETTRNFALLSDTAEQQPLSPTQFSLSVHNAIIGLWSIFQGDSAK